MQTIDTSSQPSQKIQLSGPVSAVIALVIAATVVGPILAESGISGGSVVAWVVGIVFLTVLVGGLRVIDQYERGVVLTLGKYSGTRNPGLNWVLMVFQRMVKVDLRIKVIDVPDQDCMTRDNVSVNVNAVLYYRISSADKAILEVENYSEAVTQLAQTTMRDVVGEATLDELLSKRDEISSRIQGIVDTISDPWGVQVESVDLKHIELPDDMKRTMGKEAEAERERRAVIIKAEGEKVASENLAKAAHALGAAPGALHLRTLHSLNDLSSDQSNTVVFTIPLEILRAIEGVAGKLTPKTE